MWGAFTARLARDYLGCNYQTAGKRANESVRFGYYYPAQGALGLGPDCWPWDDQIEEFAWRYLQSYMSTSLRDGRSKLDGSLHEVEYIAPFTRDNEEVWLTGPLWVEDSDPALSALRDPKSLQAFLLRLAVGADRGNGWGRFSDAHVCLLADGKAIPGTAWCWTESNGQISVTNPHAKANLLAHVKLSIPTDQDGSQAQVDLERWSLEPLVGRETQQDQKGQVLFGSEIPPAVICASPGSVAPGGKCFSVGNIGIWSLL
jgi:hypothetical protein